MNLEKDTAPTGLYNHLPKQGGRTAWQRKTGLKGIGTLKKGLLKKVGYSVSASATRRHAAVKRAVKKYGRASTIRKLNAVAVYTKKRSPVLSRKFKKDMKYAQKLKGGADDLNTLKNDIEVAELEAGGDPETVDEEVARALLTRGNSLGVSASTLADLKTAVKNKLSGR